VNLILMLAHETLLERQSQKISDQGTEVFFTGVPARRSSIGDGNRVL
jgi:hypothetical protein